MTVKLYLIHNLTRKNFAIENIRKVFGYKYQLVEIYSQKIGRLNWISYLETRLILLKMEIKLLNFNSKRGGVLLKIKLILREIKNLITFALVKNERKKLLTRAWIVYSISSKHIRAWKKISGSSESYGLIFEDDMVAKENSATHVAELLEMVDHISFSGYLDLSGGYHLFDLFKEVVVTHRLDSGTKFLKPNPPMSNTACGYLLSCDMAKFFLEIIAKNKKIRFIPIDFIINYCLDSIVGTKYQCLHAYPSVIQHGSFLGLYNSWDV